ncbi:DUF3363 domain-containing protein [Bradyrhizobium sp. Ash2021]|uniref:DUF3363 domain-containing protein n=1 Tax=Bradyrhizobium sp. Ash2021 TaxID=2954771 RepID=UPI0028164B8E|nr:DUF3363 domain-containing protein [Bradyrhizobium sp. Ash2021]WMT72616.1 DUF3363 domain-containing protein [Bradyrhizobium sp. Ash2021]
MRICQSCLRACVGRRFAPKSQAAVAPAGWTQPTARVSPWQICFYKCVRLPPRTQGGELTDSKRHVAPKAVDRTIAEIASRNHGLYSTDLHRDADLRASAEFIQSHVRRLEAMRRQSLAERLPDGEWRVGPDHLDRSAQKLMCSHR